jgi:UDP-2,3-diacylglucosamine hydrolase
MLALIAGNTDLPNIIIKKLYKKKIDFIILDLTSNKIYKNYTNSYSIKITQLDKALLILKKIQL